MDALEELIAASKHLYPGARTNGLFENFEAYGEGDKFANIGWGGTQKYLHSDKSKLKDKMAFGTMPGGMVDGELLARALLQLGLELCGQLQSARTRNWPTSSPSLHVHRPCRRSRRAIQPAISTRHAAHTTTITAIIETYSKPFLDVHYESMRDSIPDLYLKGQGEYFDELRVGIAAADAAQKPAKELLDDVPPAWSRINRRMGARSQGCNGSSSSPTIPQMFGSSQVSVTCDRIPPGGEPTSPRRRNGESAAPLLPFNVALVLPAQLTVMAVVVVPTLIVSGYR